MGRRKKEEELVMDPNEPFFVCLDCINWINKRHPNNPDAVDLSSGGCEHNGYSSVPPLFTCNGWASGNGAVVDRMNKLMESRRS